MAPPTGMFAGCLPGLAPLVRQQLDDLPGIRTTSGGFDGRADLVLFEAGRGSRRQGLTLRTTEDVFVEVSRALRADGDHPRILANRMWGQRHAERALSVWAEHKRPLAAAMTFRVVTRVLSEKAFLRTELRRHLTEVIGRNRPRWKVGDPAQVEVWACEYRPGRFISGLRLTDARMRQHDGRTIQRPGALRPTLAAAMVHLAGKPSGVLLDPCCGSGTILAEAIASGWTASGTDIDPAAAAIAARNVPGASIGVGDAFRINLPDASVGACVSNLPFGHQYQVRGNATAWLATLLPEITRVTRPGGRVVLLAADIPGRAVPPALDLTDKFPLQLLGRNATAAGFSKIEARCGK